MAAGRDIYFTRIESFSAAQRELLFLRLKNHNDKRVRSAGHSIGRLVAYIESAGAIEAREIDEYSRQRLPDYMVPRRFVFVETLPKLPNGKIDRNSLHLVDEQPGSVEEADFVAPRDATEKTLARIWAEVLGLDAVSVNDNFFEIGGDSLLSIRILARAHRDGLKIDPERFFSHPTIAAQASVAENSSPPRTETVNADPGVKNSTDYSLSNLNKAEIDQVARTLAALDDQPDPAD